MSLNRGFVSAIVVLSGLCLFPARVSAQDRGLAPGRLESQAQVQSPSPEPTAPPGLGNQGSSGASGPVTSGTAVKKQGSGLDSGIATLPAASNHQNLMKAGPEVDVLFNLVIGRIVETRRVKKSTELVWLQRILSPALGFDGRYIRPLGKGFRAAAGGKAELFFRSSGNQNASVGFTSSNSQAGSEKKFEVTWDLYGVSTWEKGPLRVHAGAEFGSTGKWVGVLSDDLGPPKSSLGGTPFVGADFRVGAKGRRIRVEAMIPLAFEKPPIAIFSKADNLFQFNVGYIKTSSGYAILGYFDQRFGIVPPQPKAKPGDPAAPAPGARMPPPAGAREAVTPAPTPVPTPAPTALPGSGMAPIESEALATPAPSPVPEASPKPAEGAPVTAKDSEAPPR